MREHPPAPLVYFVTVTVTTHRHTLTKITRIGFCTLRISFSLVTAGRTTLPAPLTI